MKTDNSIRNICIASIRRHTMLPYDFYFTSFWESGQLNEINVKLPDLINFADDELPIAMVAVDSNEFTIVTTRQIISAQNEWIKSIDPGSVISWKWNDFKGYKDKSFTQGQLTLTNKEVFEVFIETGKASMVPIYAIRTLVNLSERK